VRAIEAHSDAVIPPTGATAMSASKIGKVLRDMGPLMLVALLVPGGTLIAAFIYWLRRKSRTGV
jgi:hypothetical protein